MKETKLTATAVKPAKSTAAEVVARLRIRREIVQPSYETQKESARWLEKRRAR